MEDDILYQSTDGLVRGDRNTVYLAKWEDTFLRFNLSETPHSVSSWVVLLVMCGIRSCLISFGASRTVTLMKRGTFHWPTRDQSV
jgi:hypothetical protein